MLDGGDQSRSEASSPGDQRQLRPRQPDAEGGGLQGCAPPEAGIKRRESAPADSRSRTRVESRRRCHERRERRVGYRREVGRDLRARRGGVGGRAARDRLHLHGGAHLAPRGTGPLLLRHARRRPAQGHARRRGDRGAQAVVQVQRDDARGEPRPARLRARHELARPRAAATASRDPCVPLPGQVPEQPERRLLSAPTGRSTSPIRGTGASPASASSASASSAGRASSGSRRGAGRTSSTSPSRRTSSTCRTGSASHPTSR